MSTGDDVAAEIETAAIEASIPPPAKINHGRKTIGGTILVFIAEALIFPTGLITTSYLTARLGTDGYGAFTLAATIVSWLEWTITSVFSRPTIKFIGESENWHPVAAAVVKQYLWISTAATLVLFVLAEPLARFLHADQLAHPLRIFALDIPLFGLAQAYRNILIGRGMFTSRAVGGAARWIIRLLLILWFVGMGWWVEGAIWASIATSVIEMAINYSLVRPPLRVKEKFPMSQLWDYATPLLFSVLSLRLYEKMDLMVLQRMGGSIADAGIYGAAQNLALVPGIFAMSFTPLVLATLSRQLGQGDEQGARWMARDAMRLVILLFPAAMLAAGAADDIIAFIYKPEFAAAAGVLARLIVGSWAMMMISTTSAVLVAGGKPGWTLWVTGALLPLALIGHYILIPRFGPNGAALVTMSLGIASAIVGMAAVWILWRVALKPGTFVRGALVAVLAYIAGQHFPSHGHAIPLMVKMTLILLGSLVAFAIIGEFTVNEMKSVVSLVQRKRVAEVT
jgi:O-antigen/teichoic acid export membrane protein